MLNKLYYIIKPLIPRRLQIQLRRLIIASKLNQVRDVWPIDQKAGAAPEWFKGWPDGKQFALVVTHDVEKAGGLAKIRKLMDVENKYNIRSAIGLVPERYTVDKATLDLLRKNGNEVYVHDLNHDGKLFSNYATFHSRAPEINRYIHQWKVEGFRAGAMHHNLDWIGELSASLS